MGKYQTEQKKRLLTFLEKNAQKQFSAEELSELLQNEEGAAPGKSTVYRLVSELADEGTLRRFPKSAGRGWTYQFHNAHGCADHIHLKCEKCGTLIHLECGMGDEWLTHIAREHGFLVDNGKTVLYGLCAECRKLTLPLQKESEK